jgi:biofilm PGA synthesis protein PgaD
MSKTSSNKQIIAKDLLQNYPENLIINRPDLKSKPLIFGERILTLIFWGFWFYLWLPLISVVAWLLGFRILYSHIIELGGLDEFLVQINIFSSGIFAASGILALWSFYNLKRYGAYNRRNKVYYTDLHGLASHLSIAATELKTIQQAKTLHFSFNKQGEISTIETPVCSIPIVEKPQFICTP